MRREAFWLGIFGLLLVSGVCRYPLGLYMAWQAVRSGGWRDLDRLVWFMDTKVSKKPRG